MHGTLLEQLSAMVRSGRKIDLRQVGVRFIATAIPLDGWRGGLVPHDWRAESQSLGEAVDELFSKYQDTPSDFNWDED